MSIEPATRYAVAPKRQVLIEPPTQNKDGLDYYEAADQSVQSQLKSAVVNIENASLKRMLELEESVGLTKKSRGKGKITGLGERFRKYEAKKKAKNM